MYALHIWVLLKTRSITNRPYFFVNLELNKINTEKEKAGVRMNLLYKSVNHMKCFIFINFWLLYFRSLYISHMLCMRRKKNRQQTRRHTKTNARKQTLLSGKCIINKFISSWLCLFVVGSLSFQTSYRICVHRNWNIAFCLDLLLINYLTTELRTKSFLATLPYDNRRNWKQFYAAHLVFVQLRRCSIVCHLCLLLSIGRPATHRSQKYLL